MSLLSDSKSYAENSELMANLLEGIGLYIVSNVPFGIEKFQFGRRSIDRACHIAAERIFNDSAFPDAPGPFKRAAAAAILTRSVVETSIRAAQGQEALPKDQVDAWKARIAYLTIRPILQFSSVKLSETETVALNAKLWKPPTLHVKLEMIAWLRWLDNFQLDAGVLHTGRLCRAVMAFAMIIEQAYYLVNATPSCHVMGQGNCLPSGEDMISGWDMWFNKHP